VLGTTARARSANWRVLDARTGAAEAVAAATAKPVAILFGGERSGLANEALERCQALIRIPADDAYDALNLAQAVQVVCYEIRMAMPGTTSIAGSAELATADEMQALQVHVERVMRLSGFMHADNAAQLGARVRRLLARALPDGGEVRILRGWLAAIERRLRPAK
jgi:TrmH family RNA methyltransferase